MAIHELEARLAAGNAAGGIVVAAFGAPLTEPIERVAALVGDLSLLGTLPPPASAFAAPASAADAGGAGPAFAAADFPASADTRRVDARASADTLASITTTDARPRSAEADSIFGTPGNVGNLPELNPEVGPPAAAPTRDPDGPHAVGSGATFGAFGAPPGPAPDSATPTFPGVPAGSPAAPIAGSWLRPLVQAPPANGAGGGGASDAPPPVPTPVVTVATADPTASAMSGTTAAFQVSRSGDTSAPLTVAYTLGGAAVNGTDYQALGGSVTIAAGAAAAAVTVLPLKNVPTTVAKTVDLTLSGPGAGGAYALGDATQAEARVYEDTAGWLPPNPAGAAAVINVGIPGDGSGADPWASRFGGNTGAFTLTRDGSADGPLSVSYAVGGTATPGADYRALSGSATFAAGQRVATVEVDPLANSWAGSDKTVTLTVTGGVNYVLGTTTIGTVTIWGGPGLTLGDSFYDTPHGEALTVDADSGVLSNAAGGVGPLAAALVPGKGTAHGTLQLAADGSFAYTPAAGFVGTDSFQYTASDGVRTTPPVTATIDVTDEPPVAQDDAYALMHDSTLTVGTYRSVLANDVDPDGDPLSAQLVAGSGPQHGTLDFHADGTFAYTPNAGYAGPDAFQYRASDGYSTSDPATVTLTVRATVPAPPVAMDQSYSFSHSETLGIGSPGVLDGATDADNDPLYAVPVAGSGPQHGTLTLNADGSFAYVPQAGYIGPDSFQYKASDGIADSNVATVSVAVTNSPPVAPAVSAYSVYPGGPTVVSAENGLLRHANDDDEDTISAVWGTGPAHGTLVLNDDGSFTYTPAPDFSGTDSFTYEVGDGYALSPPSTVTLTTAPVAVDDAYELDVCTCNHALEVDAEHGVLANDYGVSPDQPLTASLVSGYGPQHGRLDFRPDGSFAYVPDAGFAGTDSFRYVVSNGVASATATVTLTVTLLAAADGPLPVATYPAAQRIANQGVLKVDACPDKAGPDVTAWYARDLIRQIRHRIQTKRDLNLHKDIMVFRNQAANLMSYKWMNFGRPGSGKGVNTVTLGDTVLRKNQLGNIAFMIVPTLYKTDSDLTRVGAAWKSIFGEDEEKKLVLRKGIPNAKRSIEAIALIGYYAGPYYEGADAAAFGPPEKVYRADNLAAFSVGHDIGLAFMDAIAPGNHKKARETLESMLDLDEDDPRLNPNIEELGKKMERVLRLYFEGDRRLAAESIDRFRKFQPVVGLPAITLDTLTFTPSYKGFNTDSLDRKGTPKLLRSVGTSIGVGNAIMAEYRKDHPGAEDTDPAFIRWRQEKYEKYTEAGNGVDIRPTYP